MSQYTSHPLTSLVAWSILPSLLTSLALKGWYQLFPSSAPRLPTSPSPSDRGQHAQRGAKHQRRARVVVIVGYLIYSLGAYYASQAEGEGRSHYRLLGLPRGQVTEGGAQTVKSHWRKLARVYHPDKVGQAGEGLFVRMRSAVEVLEVEDRRWAYDRLGPSAATWRAPGLTNKERERELEVKEYVKRGCQAALGWWVMSGAGMAGMGWLHGVKEGGWWRAVWWAGGLCLELMLIMRTRPLPLLNNIIPLRLPFEQILLLRQAFIALSCAFGQLAPFFLPPPRPTTSQELDHFRPLVEALFHLSSRAEQETARAQAALAQPLFTEPGGEGKELQRLKEGMRSRMSQIRVRSDPRTRGLWEKAVKGSYAGVTVKQETEKEKEKEKEVKSELADPFLVLPVPVSLDLSVKEGEGEEKVIVKVEGGVAGGQMPQVLVVGDAVTVEELKKS